MLTTCYSVPFHFMFFAKERKAFAWDCIKYRKTSDVVNDFTRNNTDPVTMENLSHFDGPFLITSNYFVRK